jgi:hypothetical protein
MATLAELLAKKNLQNQGVQVEEKKSEPIPEAPQHKVNPFNFLALKTTGAPGKTVDSVTVTINNDNGGENALIETADTSDEIALDIEDFRGSETNSEAEGSPGDGGDEVAPEAVIPSISAEQFNHPAMGEKLGGGEIEAFKQNLELLRGSFDNPEILSNAIRNILRSTRENPNFCGILAPEDCQLMVRALRQNYGAVATTKSQNKGKRAESKKTVGKIEDMLGDITALGNLQL